MIIIFIGVLMAMIFNYNSFIEKKVNKKQRLRKIILYY